MDDDAIARFLDETMMHLPDHSEADLSTVLPEFMADIRDPIDVAQDGN